MIDRAKPIFLDVKEKKKNFEKVGDRLKGQLRSSIGSLAWLARVCRPDLSYSVCKLQSCVHSPTYEDVKYPRKAFVFEGALVVGIQDASHAADYDLSGSGEKLGFSSQSGRLLCLAHRDSQQSKCGALMLLECHSTVIKRVGWSRGVRSLAIHSSWNDTPLQSWK